MAQSRGNGRAETLRNCGWRVEYETVFHAANEDGKEEVKELSEFGRECYRDMCGCAVWCYAMLY